LTSGEHQRARCRLCGASFTYWAKPDGSIGVEHDEPECEGFARFLKSIARALLVAGHGT
jgi:hypothetical protein